MQPFSMAKNAYGQDTRVPWDRLKANAKFKQMRQEVIREMNDRDCKVASDLGLVNLIDGGKRDGDGKWIPGGGGVLRTAVLSEADAKPINGRMPDRKYAINFATSQIKHSGAETADLLRKRWWAFCSEPQVDDFVIAAPVFKPKETREFKPPPVLQHAQATEHQFENTAVRAEDRPQSRKDEWVDKPKPKGRPFGSKNKPKAQEPEGAYGQLPEHG